MRKRITKAAKPERDKQIYDKYIELKKAYPFWCWEALINQVRCDLKLKIKFCMVARIISTENRRESKHQWPVFVDKYNIPHTVKYGMIVD